MTGADTQTVVSSSSDTFTETGNESSLTYSQDNSTSTDQSCETLTGNDDLEIYTLVYNDSAGSSMTETGAASTNATLV